MPELSLAEHSAATQNAILVAKIAKALRPDVGGGRDEVWTALLDRGADFLRRIVESAVLVEQAEPLAGFQASAKGLDEFGHALSALRLLDQLAREDGVAPLLASLRDDLVSLSRGEHLAGQRREALRRFFLVLGKVLEDEVLGSPPVSLRAPTEVQFHHHAS